MVGLMFIQNFAHQLLSKSIANQSGAILIIMMNKMAERSCFQRQYIRRRSFYLLQRRIMKPRKHVLCFGNVVWVEILAHLINGSLHPEPHQHHQLLLFASAT